MARTNAKQSKMAGLPPGTLLYVGEKTVEPVRMTVIDYDAEHFAEKQVAEAEECFPLKMTPTTTWINISGIHRPEIIEKLGGAFGLHPLLQEDILNTGQRPKFEDYEEYIFIVLKMLTYDQQRQAIQSEQVSLVLGSTFVISFQENGGDVFDLIRDHIRHGKGRIRKMGPDYLVHALIDAVVDNYFVIMEKLGERIESLEERLVKNPQPSTLEAIHKIKREMIFLRRAVWPLREAIGGLERSESKLLGETTAVYFRDVYDHTIQVMDMIESFRDMVSGMMDIYLSSISNRMNAVMKVLTTIATIFMPLTFIAGVYGMNFKHMPELEALWGYPMALGIMTFVGTGMLYVFKKKRWL
jgi:magnesium transporter